MHRLLAPLVCVCLAGAVRAGEFPPADKLPAHAGLPDPLVMFDGTPVRTADDWVKKRRPELKKLLQHYMYGTLPAPVKVQGKVEREDRKALGNKAIVREVTLTLGGVDAAKVHLLLVLPAARKGPVPVFVGINFNGNHRLLDDRAVRLPTGWVPNTRDHKASDADRGKDKEVWALDQAVGRGYAVATFYTGDIDPDNKTVRGGVRPYFDRENKAGAIAFWAWGIHRAVDYLLSVPELDGKRVAVVGHSRLGKTALVAAAFDERIALCVPLQAGCGGTAPSRGTVGESVKRINTAFPHWFNAEFKKFNDHPDRLPFDQNALTALVAPRPVLFGNATEDAWANPEGQFEVLQAAGPVYRLLKAGGLASPAMPKVGVLGGGTLGYFIRPGKHSMTRGDWKVFFDFADRHLPPAAR
jgi:hypothetical protein